jgi:CRP/FNR family transcriptional regulator, nitrogen oxide reductase regulator
MTAAHRPRTVTFASLPAQVAACCLRVGRRVNAIRGMVLARQGEEAAVCYYVHSGYAKAISSAPDGHDILVGFMGPRDVIGQSAAAQAGDRYLATTTASEAMELVAWPRSTALELAERFPEVHARLEALLLRNTEILLKRLHTVGGQARVPQRLASILLELAVRHGTRDQPGIAIGPKVTREDLAALTGTSLYTVSRVLADWQRQGLLVSRRGRLHVIAASRLRELAGDDDPPTTRG